AIGPSQAVDPELVPLETGGARQQVPPAGDSLADLGNRPIRPQAVDGLINRRVKMKEPDPGRVGSAPIEGLPRLRAQLRPGNRRTILRTVAVEPSVPIPVMAGLGVEETGEVARPGGEVALGAQIVRRAGDRVPCRSRRGGREAQRTGGG